MFRQFLASANAHPTASTIDILQAKLQTVERALAVIEFDLRGNILRANENFLKVIGYTAPEVVGRHHSMFVPPGFAETQEYKDFWARLGTGQLIAERFQRVGKGGVEVWLEASYNPVFDAQGKPISVVKYATDITDAVRREAENSGQIAAVNRAQAVISFAMDGTILSANENFLNLMGYRAEEVIGRHHRIFVAEAEAASPAYSAFWHKLNAGEFAAAEFKRIAKDGHEVWIQASYNPIFDPNGKAVKIVKFATDITAVKANSADDAAQITAIERAQAVIAFDLQGNVLSANENFLKTFGYREDEVIGRHHRLFVDPAYAASPAYAKFWQNLRDNKLHAGEFKRIGKAGNEIWLQATYNPIYDLSGRINRIIKFATDITATVEQREKFNLLSLVVDETDNAVVIADAQQRIIYVNRGFERLTGYSADEVKGRNPRFLQGPATDKATVTRIRETLQEGKPFYEEILNYTKDKTPYWISVAINPVRDANGNIKNFISVQANITATKLRALEFTTKIDAIGKSNAMAEWSTEGDPVDGNHILSGDEKFNIPLAQILQPEAIEGIMRHGTLRTEIQVPRAGSTPLWVDAFFYVLENLKGKPERILMCGTDISARRTAIAESVKGMSDMLSRTSVVLESINGFARQTSLLSVNAAIEAARANQAGRGFAIVADEIRKLASAASGSIGEVDKLLADGRAQIAAMSDS